MKTKIINIYTGYSNIDTEKYRKAGYQINKDFMKLCMTMPQLNTATLQLHGVETLSKAITEYIIKYKCDFAKVSAAIKYPNINGVPDINCDRVPFIIGVSIAARNLKYYDSSSVGNKSNFENNSEMCFAIGKEKSKQEMYKMIHITVTFNMGIENYDNTSICNYLKLLLGSNIDFAMELQKWGWKRDMDIKAMDWATVVDNEPGFRDVIFKATRTLYQAVAGKSEWYSVDLNIRKKYKKQEWINIKNRARFVF